MNDMITFLFKNYFSSIPENEFVERLQSLGIEDKNIQKIKDFIKDEGKEANKS